MAQRGTQRRRLSITRHVHESLFGLSRREFPNTLELRQFSTEVEQCHAVYGIAWGAYS